MKTLLSAAAIALGVATAAQAATYQAVFSNAYADAGVLNALGADENATTMTFTWEVDETSAPLGAPYSYTNSYYYTYDYIRRRYASFSLEVGGVSFEADISDSHNDAIYIRDGKTDGIYDINDFFQVYTNKYMPLGDGWRLNNFNFYVYDQDESVMSGLDHPTLEQLLSFDQHGYATVSLYNTMTGKNSYLRASGVPTITEVSSVPLPAGGALLVAGLAGLAVIRRRQRA